MDANFVPIIFFLVTGLVIVSYYYFRSRERQLLIDKGLTPEQIREFFKYKKDHLIWLKIGVISILFGLGLGFGMMLEDIKGGDYWIPLFIFTFMGIGFVAAFFLARKYDTNQ